MDNSLIHLCHYHEGYRESMLTLIHGENIVWDKFQIDTARYSPGSARDTSYQEGWNKAIQDYNLIIES